MSGGVADRLDHLADAAESSGTVGEKAAEPLHEDATFARTPRPAGTGAVLKPLLPFVLAVGVAFLLDRLRGRRYGPRARRTAPLGPRWSMLAGRRRRRRRLHAPRPPGGRGVCEGLTGRDAPGRR